MQCKRLLKTLEMIETADCLDSHSIGALAHLPSAYGPLVSGRLFNGAGIWKTISLILVVCQSLSSASCRMSGSFLWSRNREGSSSLVLAKFSGHFPVGPACPVYTTYIVTQSRQEQFLYSVANLTTLKTNSIKRSFLVAHHLWSKLVLPGANVSRCHENPYINKPF